MDVERRARISRFLTVVAVALALAVSAYGAYLLILGIAVTTVPAVPIGDPLPDPTSSRQPTRPA